MLLQKQEAFKSTLTVQVRILEATLAIRMYLNCTFQAQVSHIPLLTFEVWGTHI